MRETSVNRILRIKDKLPLLLLAGLILEAIYYNIAFDILLIVCIFSAAFSLGSFLDIKGRLHIIDKILVQLSAGLGIAGLVIWLTTFRNMNYKSLFLILSFVVMGLRYKQLRRAARYCRRIILVTNRRNRLFFPIILLFAAFYIINASYPILRSDASAKHLAIPLSILNKTHWDYNIIEGLYFGDYALLSHMHSLYLLALGGTKALQLFVSSLSFMSLFMLLRLSVKIDASNSYVNSISLLYLTTPIIFMFSNNLFADIFPVFFFLAVLLLVADMRRDVISRNMHMVAFLMGSAIFAKQSAVYFLVPSLFIIVSSTLPALFKKEVSLSARSFLKVMGSFVFLLLPFVPSMLVIWHKTGNPFFPYYNGVFESVYFDKLNFVDLTWEKHPLGFNISSFLSMILHSGRHWEWSDGGIGYFLLLLPAAPIILLIRRNKTALSLLLFVLLSYWVSTFGSSNLRYRMGIVALAMPLCSLVLVSALHWVRNERVRTVLLYGAIVALLVPNLRYIFTPQWLTYSPKMLHANQDLTLVENEKVLSSVNKEGIRVVSNNDQARGAFRGEFYNISWYNTFLMNKVVSKEISPVEFLKAFDYYLVRKDSSYYYPEFFSLGKDDIKEILEPFSEDDRYLLFKIKHDDILKSEVFVKPIIVTAEKPEGREFENRYGSYKIIIEAEKTKKRESSGRFQINWVNKSGTFSISPFKLDAGRKIYVSPPVEADPSAEKGVLFLTSHDATPILIHSYRLIGIKKRTTFLQAALNEYNKKWPHLAKQRPL